MIHLAALSLPQSGTWLLGALSQTTFLLGTGKLGGMGAGRDAYRLGLVLEGEYHGLREVANFGVLYNNTQYLLTQDLAGILVLDI